MGKTDRIRKLVYVSTSCCTSTICILCLDMLRFQAGVHDIGWRPTVHHGDLGVQISLGL